MKELLTNISSDNNPGSNPMRILQGEVHMITKLTTSKMLLLSASALFSTAVMAQDSSVPAAIPAAEAAAVQTVAPMAAAEMSTVILAAGTAVNFSMDRALATDKREFKKGEKKPAKDQRRMTNPGDVFSMTVLNDVKVGDHVVIPKGARGTGEVLSVIGRGGFGKSGKIEVRLNSVAVGDKVYAMEGTHLQKGKGRGGAAVAGVILLGALAGAFIKGDEADIPATAELMFRTKEAITVDVPKSTLAVEAVKDAVAAAVPTT
jgi:hypothetical protein